MTSPVSPGERAATEAEAEEEASSKREAPTVAPAPDQHGWWRTRDGRPKYTFALSDSQKDLLLRVAWAEEPVARLEARLNGMPQGWAFVFSRPGALVLGILGYFALGFTAAFIIEQPGLLPLSIALLIAAALLLAGTIIRDHKVSAASADMYAVNRLLHVIDMAEALIEDPVSTGARHRLARAISDAEGFLGHAYPPKGRVPKRHRKGLAREARRCAAVLRSYVDVAFRGETTAVGQLQEDFARAVLRVASGNWSQVADLRPTIGGGRRLRDYLPQVSVRELLTFLAAALAAAATIVKAMTG